MKYSFLAIPLVLVSYGVNANPNASEPTWEIIPVESELTIIDDKGESRTIEPACAFDTIPGTDIDNAFHFYFKEGKSDKLIIYFNGGGACWDDSTCVTSLAMGDRPTYNPTIHQANSPIGAGGIFDDENENNPFQDWSKVFIPYCSGDIHVGSSEVTYYDIDVDGDGEGELTGHENAPISVKHHGFDNFLAVREWVKTRFSTSENSKTNKLEKLLVTGSSAGGYGATLNFPYIQDTFPKTDAVLLADASEAVVTQGWIDSVFSNGKNWNLENTLPSIFAEDLGSYTAGEFNNEIYSKLTAEYPNSRFAQYTTALDVVQVQFLKIMTQLDAKEYNPEDWAFEFPEDNILFGSWNFQMESSLQSIADMTDNYQFYIGEGTVHTILTDDFATDPDHHPFYDEHSAEGVFFTDWLDSFVNDKKFNEENLKDR